MKANRQQVDKALQNPAATRLFLFHGPDEAGSLALARRIGVALGAEAEKIALSGAELRSDPARLPDEAAALSMFGSGRWILVSPAGEESLEAVTALLEATAAGNPVVLVAGALKSTSKLLKLVTAAPGALAFASFVPDARDFVRTVTEMARVRGLALRPDQARWLVDATGSNRAIVEQELDKLALYLDAGLGRSVQVESEDLAAIGAAMNEGDTAALVEHLFSGDPRGVEMELNRLRSEGMEGITLLRAALRRALLLARLRSEVDGGQRPSAVMERQGRSLFWKEKDAVERQLEAWDGNALARCVARLSAAEAEVKRSGGLGPVSADAALLTIARVSARRS